MPTKSFLRHALVLPVLLAISATALVLTAGSANASRSTTVTGITTSATAAPATKHFKHKLRRRKILHAVRIAAGKVGDPYVYGAAGPSAFDCSGLTSFSFHRAGLRLPRTAAAQYGYVRHIKKRNMMRGDLMFFHSGSSVYHVAIFMRWLDGHRVMLHAPFPGAHVHRATPWTSSWWAGTLRH